MWPEGMHAAAALTFDFDAEEVSVGEDRRTPREILEAGHEPAHHVFLANPSPVAVSRSA